MKNIIAPLRNKSIKVKGQDVSTKDLHATDYGMSMRPVKALIDPSFRARLRDGALRCNVAQLNAAADFLDHVKMIQDLFELPHTATSLTAIRGVDYADVELKLVWCSKTSHLTSNVCELFFCNCRHKQLKLTREFQVEHDDRGLSILRTLRSFE